MKKIFVTGATGMIGLALIEHCIQHKIKVTILVRKNSAKNYKLPPESELINYIYGEVTELDQLQIDIDYDTCYHFAWLGTDRISRDSMEVQVQNIHVTLELIKFAKKIGCKKFIGAGSQAEYGRVDELISENTKCQPITAYGITKYFSGILGEMLSKELGMSFVWARIFSVYGINDGEQTMISQCLRHIITKKIFHLSSCEQIWNFLYSEDCGKAMFLLGNIVKTDGFYNIAHANSKPLKEFIAQIVECTQQGQYLSLGEPLQNPLNLQVDISKLEQDTEFVPQTSFDEGISYIWSFLTQNQGRG